MDLTHFQVAWVTRESFSASDRILGGTGRQGLQGGCKSPRMQIRLTGRTSPKAPASSALAQPFLVTMLPGTGSNLGRQLQPPPLLVFLPLPRHACLGQSQGLGHGSRGLPLLWRSGSCFPGAALGARGFWPESRPHCMPLEALSQRKDSFHFVPLSGSPAAWPCSHSQHLMEPLNRWGPHIWT